MNSHSAKAIAFLVLLHALPLARFRNRAQAEPSLIPTRDATATSASGCRWLPLCAGMLLIGVLEGPLVLAPIACARPAVGRLERPGKSQIKAGGAFSLFGPAPHAVAEDTKMISETREPAPGHEPPAKGAGLNLVGWEKVRGRKSTAVRTVLQTLDGVVYGWKEHEFMTPDGRPVVAIEMVSPKPKRLSLREAQDLISRSEGTTSIPPKPEEAEHIPASQMPKIKAMERRFDPNTQKGRP